MSNERAMVSHLIARLIKKHYTKMSQYFPKPSERSNENINFKSNLSNYVAKANLKGVMGVNISNIIAKPDLVGLKAEVHKIDGDEIKALPAHLRKPSIIVDNDVVKKIVRNKY